MDNNTLIHTVSALNQRTYASSGTLLKPSIEALALAKKHNNPALIAQSHTAQGDYYAMTGNPDSAIYHLTIAEAIYKQLPSALQDPWWLGLLYARYGIAYDDFGDYAQALQCHKRALSISLESGDGYGQQRGLINIGHIFYRMGKGEQTIDFLGQAVRHPEQSPYLTGAAFSLLGDAYTYKSHHELAKSSYLRAADFLITDARKRQYLAQAAASCVPLGELEEAENLIVSAESYTYHGQAILDIEVALLIAKCKLAIAKQAYESAWGICLTILNLTAGASQTQLHWEATFYQALILFKQGDYDASIAFLNELNNAHLPFTLTLKIQQLFVELYIEKKDWKQSAQILQALNQKDFIDQSKLLSIHQLNEQIYQSQKAQETYDLLTEKKLELEMAHYEKDQLLHVISHDLKNPITAAAMILDLLIMTETRMPQENRRKCIAYAVTAITQMNSIIAQLTTSTQLSINQSNIAYEDSRLDKYSDRY